MKRHLMKVVMLIAILVALPVFSLAVKEDTSRCNCWYHGYDAKKKGHGLGGDGPGGTKDDCDLIGQKMEWEDGWFTAKAKEKRKCPYKMR